MHPRTRHFLVIAALLALLALVLLAPSWLTSKNTAQLASCKLETQPCEVVLSDGSQLSIDLGSHKLAPPQKLNLNVKLSQPVDAVFWQFNGKTMPMYLPEQPMQRLSKQHFTLTTQLALCITDPDMQWLANIRIEGASTEQLVQVDLINP